MTTDDATTINNVTTIATFLYFAYGSNMFLHRIRLSNPSAKKIGIGKLENYRLDFNTYSSRWKGAAATIVPTLGSHVWGAIYEIEDKDLASLDQQEGVASNIYTPLQVDVKCPGGGLKKCRTYQQTAIPEQIANLKDLPMERRPSKIYLNVVTEGAKESLLPQDYQNFLNNIPDNGYEGDVDLNLDLSKNDV